MNEVRMGIRGQGEMKAKVQRDDAMEWPVMGRRGIDGRS